MNLITLKAAGEALGVTPDNLRQSIARGTFKATKVGRDWLVDPKEIERYRIAHRRGRTAPEAAPVVPAAPMPRRPRRAVAGGPALAGEALKFWGGDQ